MKRRAKFGLARPVLFLNLTVQNQLGGSGEPGYLSLHALLRAPPLWDVAGRAVFVCENPDLVAIAADALGVECAPLACTDGMPAAAQRTLLMQLSAAGARLHYCTIALLHYCTIALRRQWRPLTGVRSDQRRQKRNGMMNWVSRCAGATGRSMRKR